MREWEKKESLGMYVVDKVGPTMLSAVHVMNIHVLSVRYHSKNTDISKVGISNTSFDWKILNLVSYSNTVRNRIYEIILIQ
jgi:hypothetical protein